MANDSSGADIRITVGLDTSCSKTFAAEVQAMVSSMEVPKIKVGLDIDDSSLNNLRSQLGKIGNGNSFKDFWNQARSSANSVNELTKSVSNYTGSAKQLASVQNTYKNSIDGTTSKITSQVNANGKLVESNRQVTQTYQTEKQAAQEYANANKQVEQTMRTIGSLQKNLTDSGGGNTQIYTNLEELKDSINGLWTDYSNGGSYEDFKLGLTEIQTQLVRDKAAIQEYTQVQKEAQNAEKLYVSELKNDATIRNLHTTAINQAKTALDKYADAEKSENEQASQAYAQMKAAATGIDDVYEAYLKDKMGAEECSAQMKNLSSISKESAQSLEQMGYGAETLGQKFSNLVQTFVGLFSAARLMNYAISAMRNMISESIELNDAMTQLRIVTNETESAYEEYGSSVAKTAQEIGASITDLTDSTTTYARLGYTLEESSDLAEYTSMLQNVGDIEVADAQDALTSIIKAFGIETDEIESIMDKLVAVGNNYPISVEQLAIGMTNASSTLSAAGNDLEQSIALLMAANVTISFCRTM